MRNSLQIWFARTLVLLSMACIAMLRPTCVRAEGFGTGDFTTGGSALLRSAIQESGASNFIGVGRQWNGKQYVGLLASYLVSDGSQDLSFGAGFEVGTGRRLIDFAGAGLDNLCNNVVSLGSSNYLAACRSMRSNALQAGWSSTRSECGRTSMRCRPKERRAVGGRRAAQAAEAQAAVEDLYSRIGDNQAAERGAAAIGEPLRIGVGNLARGELVAGRKDGNRRNHERIPRTTRVAKFA